MSNGEPGRIQIRRCLYRKSDSATMEMKSAEDGARSGEFLTHHDGLAESFSAVEAPSSDSSEAGCSDSAIASAPLISRDSLSGLPLV